MVYTFKQLLRARYYDGDDYRCIHQDTPSDQLQLLLEEAETVDSFMFELREFQQKSNCLTFQDLLDCFGCDPTLSKTLVELVDEPQGFPKKLVVRHQFLELCRQVVGLNMPALQFDLENDFETEASALAPAASLAQDPGLDFAEPFSFLGKYSEATGGGGTAGNSGNAAAIAHEQHFFSLGKYSEATGGSCGTRPIFTSEGLPNMSWPFHSIPLNPNHLDSEYDAQCDSA
jgi:hypothetical protein